MSYQADLLRWKLQERLGRITLYTVFVCAVALVSWAVLHFGGRP